MEIMVGATKLTDWIVGENTLSKSVELETSIGCRKHDIKFSFEAHPDGEVSGTLAFRFNFSISPPNNIDGKWVLVGLRATHTKGGFGSFQCAEKNWQSYLISRHRDDISRFIDSLVSEQDWMVEVMGSEGVIFEFPLPADPQFKQRILGLMRTVGQQNA